MALDSKTYVEELKNLVKNFSDVRGWDQAHNPKDLSIGLVTEASELLQIFRFLDKQAQMACLKQSKSREAVQDELADALCFILRFCEKYDFDLTEALKQKLAKNQLKYPVPKKDV